MYEGYLTENGALQIEDAIANTRTTAHRWTKWASWRSFARLTASTAHIWAGLYNFL